MRSISKGLFVLSMITTLAGCGLAERDSAVVARRGGVASASKSANGVKERKIGLVYAVERSFTVDLEACKAAWDSNYDFCSIEVLELKAGEEDASNIPFVSTQTLSEGREVQVRITAYSTGYQISVTEGESQSAVGALEYVDAEAILAQAVAQLPGGVVKATFLTPYRP